MPLDEYRQKRKFDKTPEPTGGQSKSEKLSFVVQKHAASHLHYDFRLEIKGVLKSWAVPKGPSMNPEEHRLAQAVEDHPYDYRDFEGQIPKGQYGGGTVIVWDEGYYEPAEKIKGKKDQEHWLMSHYFKRELRIVLHGKKLKGEFLLKAMRERGENAWILSKVADKWASANDIREKNKSVLSGLTIEQMAENPQAKVWDSKHREQPGKNKEKLDIPGTAAPHPWKIEPMLATLIRDPFDDEDWIFEVKFDGYRILAHKEQESVGLLTRKLDLTKNYGVIADELKAVPNDFVLDGEVVVLDEHGHPDFDALQRYKGNKPLAYYVFDLLWLDGRDLTALPLLERKQLLQAILPETETLRLSRHFDQGKQLFEAVAAQGLEGIMAKRKDSTYLPGKRTRTWLKLPTRKTQDFVVGGWTESGSAHAFRSLIFGNFKNGVLTYVGHAGIGFREAERKKVLEQLKKLEVPENPFNTPVETETAVHWVKPELVIIVEFATWTDAGNIRKPATFKGFRTDKAPGDVQPEEPLSAAEESKVVSEPPEAAYDAINTAADPNQEVDYRKEAAVEEAGDQPERTNNPPAVPPEKNRAALRSPEESNWPKVDAEQIKSEGIFPIEGHEVRLSNIEREIWPGINKASLIRYYHEVAPYLLPHLQDRPLSLHIKNLGPTRPGFYIKDMEGRQPEYSDIFTVDRKHRKKGKRDKIDYLLCNNEATLLYIINLGCIDLNPWTSRATSPGEPDYIVIDLDPSDNDWKKVLEAARATKEVFDHHQLHSFIKTSGKTGMHMLLPCTGFTFPHARSIAEHLCGEIQQLVPDITTTEVSVQHRGNKLYLDPNQNDYADTIAAPYSLRPFEKPILSTPLEWKEVNGRLDPESFTIHTMAKRLVKKGELFTDLLNLKLRSQNTERLRAL